MTPSFWERCLAAEDAFLAAVQRPAVARLLTFVVTAAVIGQHSYGLRWCEFVVAAGAALGIYGSVHRS